MTVTVRPHPNSTKLALSDLLLPKESSYDAYMEGPFASCRVLGIVLAGWLSSSCPPLGSMEIHAELAKNANDEVTTFHAMRWLVVCCLRSQILATEGGRRTKG